MERTSNRILAGIRDFDHCPGSGSDNSTGDGNPGGKGHSLSNFNLHTRLSPATVSYLGLAPIF